MPEYGRLLIAFVGATPRTVHGLCQGGVALFQKLNDAIGDNLFYAHGRFRLRIGCVAGARGASDTTRAVWLDGYNIVTTLNIVNRVFMVCVTFLLPRKSLHVY
jgi:hypothetical protein